MSLDLYSDDLILLLFKVGIFKRGEGRKEVRDTVVYECPDDKSAL